MTSDNLEQEIKNVVENVKLSNRNSLINVEISDVLTPVTCAFLINEILQGLLYQKCQIPYPYSWLKSVVDNKRGKIESEETYKKPNVSASIHFRIVSTAYDTLERLTKEIIKEFSKKGEPIKEVVILFGATPQCPKEIYTIEMSSLAKGHLENNYVSPKCKCRQNILRKIFLSQDWLDAADNSMSCTNTYVFLKKAVMYNRDSLHDANDYFKPSRPLTFPPKTKHIKINLNYKYNNKTNCNCNNFYVFEDVSNSVAKECKAEEIQETITWYQSKELFKGFKDCYINKVAASELW